MDKKKIQIIALVALFAIIGLVVVYQTMNLSAPAGAKKKAAIEEKVGNYEQRLQKAEMMVKRLRMHRKLVEEEQAKLDSYRSDIPSQSDHTWLSRQINRVREDIGLSEVSQKFRQGLSTDLPDKEMAKKYAQRTWEIQMKCDYHDLGRFLDSLEESNRFVEVVDIRIEGNKPEGQDITLLIRYLVRK